MPSVFVPLELGGSSVRPESTCIVSSRIPVPVAEALEKEADLRGITLSRIVRNVLVANVPAGAENQ
jgi:hypothetical protein